MIGSTDSAEGKGRSGLKRDLAPLFAIAAVHVLLMLVISPIGDFPLNDDWVHAQAIEDFLEAGSYQHHPYMVSTLIAQVMWGALLSIIFGFSFTVLRLGTIFLSACGCCALYGAGRVSGASRPVAALGAFLLLAQPLYLSQSYSFMLDVPYIACTCFSAWAYLLAAKTWKPRYVLLGTIAAVIGFLIRPFAVIATGAFGAMYLWALFRGRTRLTWQVFASGVVPWAAGILIYFLFVAGKGEQSSGELGLSASYLVFTSVFGFQHWFASLYYLGLGILPIFLGVLVARFAAHAQPPGWRLPRIAVLAIVIIACASGPWAVVTMLGEDFFESMGVPTIAALADTPYRMPLMGNTLSDTGFGPVTTGLPQGRIWYAIGGWWWIPTLLAGITAAWWIVASASALRMREVQETDENGATHSQILFLAIWALFGLVLSYNPLRGWGFDRYLLTPLVPAILLGLQYVPKIGRRHVMMVSGAATALLLAIGVMALRDYVEVHRTVYQSYMRLIDEYGAEHGEIDAGFSLNGYYNSRGYRAETGEMSFSQRGEHTTWHVGMPDYKVIIGENVDGYSPLFSVPFSTWLGGREFEITALEYEGGG